MLMYDDGPSLGANRAPGGGESFAARQRRLRGEQTHRLAQVDDVAIERQSPEFQPQSQVPVSTPDGNNRNLAEAPRAPEPAPAAAPAPQAPQAAAPPQAPQPAPVAPATPVTGNGKIPPPAPTLPPFSSGASAPLQARQVPQAPVSVYKPTEFKVANPQLGELPAAYGGTNITQFAAPDQSALTAGQSALAQKILAQPETMSPEIVAQLKEKNKESALLMQQQIAQAIRQGAVGRGAVDSGRTLAREEGAFGDMLNQVLTGNRDIDIAAAQTNRADQLQALGAIESLLSGQMGRASTVFGNTLQGQTAQAADSRTAAQDAIARAITGYDASRQGAEFDLRQQGANADERFRGHQSERSAEDAALQRVLAQFGIDESVANNTLANRGETRADAAFGLQRELGIGGLELDRFRTGEQSRQFDESNALNILQFLEQQRQHNNNLGFNYNQLQNSGQNSLVQMVMSLLGG
jgi:hypothetical protein